MLTGWCLLGPEQDGAGDGCSGRLRDAGFHVRRAGGGAFWLGNGETRPPQTSGREWMLFASKLLLCCFLSPPADATTGPSYRARGSRVTWVRLKDERKRHGLVQSDMWVRQSKTGKGGGMGRPDSSGQVTPNNFRCRQGRAVLCLFVCCFDRIFTALCRIASLFSFSYHGKYVSIPHLFLGFCPVVVLLSVLAT